MEPVAFSFSWEAFSYPDHVFGGSVNFLNPFLIFHQGHQSSSDDLRNLSDAWEFQENEIMHAQNKLRSTRAKLAVLEGKMALAIMYAKFLFKYEKRVQVCNLL